MHQTIQDLLARSPIVTDGGWGTSFQAKGLPRGASPDTWNLTKPDIVREVAGSYVEAGSQIILSNTFGANSIMLGRHGVAEKAVAINEAGARLSKEAAGEDVLVFASVGPTGVMLFLNEAAETKVFDSFQEQTEALAAGGADGILVESFTDINEAALGVKAAVRTGLPVVVSVVFDSGDNLDHTMMGQTPEEAANVLKAAGADLVGSNCGKGIEAFGDVCRRLHQTAGEPVWIKANAGMPEMIDGKTVFSQTPEEFAEYVPALIAGGAAFIGGCCGTNPDFIRAIRRKLDG